MTAEDVLRALVERHALALDKTDQKTGRTFYDMAQDVLDRPTPGQRFVLALNEYLSLRQSLETFTISSIAALEMDKAEDRLAEAIDAIVK